jgi:phosphoglycolate phosphatase
MLSHIIFDLDGTLVDSAPSILDCFQELLQRNNLKSSISLTNDIIGPPLLETIKKITHIYDENLLNILVKDFQDIYDNGGYRSLMPFEGINHLLSDLNHSDFKLHIATNKRLKPTLLIIGDLQWDSFFSSIYASDSQGKKYANKAEMIKSLLADNKISCRDAIYIGDTYQDAQAASHNGLEFIFVSWGYGGCETQYNEFIAENAAILKMLINDCCYKNSKK